ncbi:hypothetical protein DY000_02042043 [Brassica cretica]|uniref:Uncharacterized protein n=1 Tax=Brassica cretica TaxID=69181 RepID=A0ABQ7BG03_BRACR|nr:hypothetical protein DY000_02042043 [Brassica cretica]
MHGLMSYRRFGRARLLRSDRAEETLGHYVTTELWLELVAINTLEALSIDTVKWRSIDASDALSIDAAQPSLILLQTRLPQIFPFYLT